MASGVINFAQKLARFSEHWSPRLVAEMNDYQFKLVKLQGEFVWHDHKDTDEVFIVLHGEMEIGFRDRTVTVRAARCSSCRKASSTSPARRASATPSSSSRAASSTPAMLAARSLPRTTSGSSAG